MKELTTSVVSSFNQGDLMFDKVHKEREPTFWEDLRRTAVIAFLLAVVAPAAFGTASAAANGDRKQVAAELKEAKQNSFKFLDTVLKIVLIALAVAVLFLLIRLGFIMWLFSMIASSINR